MLVLSYPGFHEKNPHFEIGFVAAMLSTLFTAGVNVTLYDIREEHPLMLTLYSMVYCLMMGTCGFAWEMSTASSSLVLSMQLLQLTTTGALSVLSQVFKNYAIQNATGLGVVVWRYLDIPFSVLWDMVLLHNNPTPMVWIGIAIIGIGCLLRACQ
jgi:drug/metabolite transporter (DMT)-like permease